jgi:RNA polymerase sigma-70 factor, ECF subfamily
MAAPSDEQLVLDYRNGEEEALRLIIERYIGPVHNFIYHFVGNAGDAEDVTQDVFLSVWKNIGRFDAEKKFRTWIFAIAKNAAFSRLRKKKPALFSDLEEAEDGRSSIESVPDTGPLPEEIFARTDLAGELRTAVGMLGPKYRAVVLLHYEEDLTFQEIAEMTDEPLNTVKSRHRRALEMMRRLLDH